MWNVATQLFTVSLYRSNFVAFIQERDAEALNLRTTVKDREGYIQVLKVDTRYIATTFTAILMISVCT